MKILILRNSSGEQDELYYTNIICNAKKQKPVHILFNSKLKILVKASSNIEVFVFSSPINGFSFYWKKNEIINKRCNEVREI